MGTLVLTGNSSITGFTTVDFGFLIVNGTLATEEVYVSPDGILKGTGTINGDLDAEGSVGPGESSGVLHVGGDAMLANALEIDLTDTSSNRLDVAGNLDISGAILDTLVVSGSANASSYVIATYGTLTGEFSELRGIPEGYEVRYGYEGNKIALVAGGQSSPYSEWVSANALEGDNALANSDPDGDGVANLLEFILGGNPKAFSLSILPAGVVSDAVYRFRFIQKSAATSITPVVEYSSDLTEWTTAEQGIDGVTITQEALESGDISWNVGIPLEVSGKLFARLKAEAP